jgi:hypothetical protein
LVIERLGGGVRQHKMSLTFKSDHTD